MNEFFQLQGLEGFSFQLRRYNTPHWLSWNGINKKLRLLEKRGFPSSRNAKRLTFTVSPSDFNYDPHRAAQAMLARWPQFLRALESTFEQCFDKKFPPLVMWIEFHQSGFMHFHADWLCRFKLPLEWWCNDDNSPSVLSILWRIGNVHLSGIKLNTRNYAFKYAFKPLFDSSEADNPLPSWFLNTKWKQLCTVKDPFTKKALRDEAGEIIREEKTFSYRRLRKWRPSKGFYTELEKIKKEEENIFPCPKVNAPQNSSEVPKSVFEAWEQYQRKAILSVTYFDSEKKEFVSLVSKVLEFKADEGSIWHKGLSQGWERGIFNHRKGVKLSDGRMIPECLSLPLSFFKNNLKDSSRLEFISYLSKRIDKTKKEKDLRKDSKEHAKKQSGRLRELIKNNQASYLEAYRKNKLYSILEKKQYPPFSVSSAGCLKQKKFFLVKKLEAALNSWAFIKAA